MTSLIVGHIINYDADNNVTGNLAWQADQDMTCLQLYDVALSGPQVKRAMDMCKPGGMKQRHV